MNSNFKFEMNATLRDVVTGVEGQVTVRAEYTSGPRRYMLESGDGNNGVNEAWFDEDRLEIVE